MDSATESFTVGDVLDGINALAVWLRKATAVNPDKQEEVKRVLEGLRATSNDLRTYLDTSQVLADPEPTMFQPMLEMRARYTAKVIDPC